jgi:ferrochelatase
MGSPASEKEMKQFLRNMFLDPAILPMPLFMRMFLSFVISNTRYKKSWKKYELIGGSPLKGTDISLSAKLSEAIGKDYVVANAFSYTNPSIEESISSLYNKGIRDLQVIPLYPQFSFTTTGSVRRDVFSAAGKYNDLKISFTDRFFNNQYFIKFWQSLIEETIRKNNLLSTINHQLSTILLFSAHSIPEHNISKGDTYADEINESAKLIAEGLGLDYRVAYQSKIGKVKWLEPSTKDMLKNIQHSAFSIQHSILIVPISFISENLETLWDLEHDIIPYAKNNLNIQSIYRVEIPKSYPLIIETLKGIISLS